MLTCLLLSLSGTVTAYGDPVTVYSPPGMSWDERCTVESLQGLVNRRAATLFVGDPADPWLAIYRERNAMPTPRLVTTMDALLEAYAPAAKGLVVYDPDIDGTRYVAVTLAGVEDLIPVAPGVLDAHPALTAMPVVHDLRGRFVSTVEAYDWALREVMPRCNRRRAHAVDGDCDGIRTGLCTMSGFDWQTMHRGFVFNLACTDEPRESYGGALVGGSPEHRAMYVRILEALEPLAEINGYGEPEDLWCKLISEHGHYSFHYGLNWSFHTHVPHAGEFRQPGVVTPERVEVEEDKYYVCFMTSEGDTMKGPLPFFYGSWFDPARGEVPMNWGVNPLMAEYFPAMLQYFYDTGTDKDCFFAGCSGAGYVYPDYMPNLEAFGQHTALLCRMADVHCIDLWHAQSEETRVRYIGATEPLGITTNAGRARWTMPVAGVPVVDHGLMYWQHTSTPAGTSYYRDFADDELRARAVGWLVERIEEIAAAHTTPYVILVYADLHSYDRHVSLHQEAARRLDPTRFKPARLDEALSALRRWSEDRILVDADGLNNRLVWAALEGVPTYATLDLVNPGVTTRRVEVALTDHDASCAVDIEAGGRATLLDLRLPREGGATELVVRHSGGEDWHPVEVVPVALETGAKAAHFRALWDATSLCHGGGLAVPSPEAPDRLVWSSPQAGEPSGNILHGPYAEMPPGRYLVAFRMARPPGPETGAEGRIALLDVNPGGYEGLNQSLGELPVGAEDAPADGSFRWYGLEVDWPGSPNLLEARVWWDGRAPLLLDRVAVFELQ